MKLTFKNTDELQAMVREAKAAGPRGAYDTRINADTVATLWFVKDHGIYLMAGRANSEGKPETVIYGRGYNPETCDDWYEKASSAAGGDDFAETIELKADAVAAILDGTATRLVVTLTTTMFKWSMFTKKVEATA